MSDLPGWTCPAIDRVAAVVRAHVPEPERTDALIALEGLRVAHVQLRHIAAASGPRSSERVAAEVERLDQRIAALAAGRKG